jgi:hypothetical protein
MCLETFFNYIASTVHSVGVSWQENGNNFAANYSKYRVIHKSMKHFKNSQQIDYATDRGNSYADREKNSPSYF